jgi:hypothetical protein
VEALEERCVPANIFWKAAVDGNWSDASKWSAGHAPLAGDDVFILRTGAAYTVNVDSAVNIRGLTLYSPDATLSDVGQTISTAGRADLDAGHVLLRNAHWQGTGTLNNLSDSASMVAEGNSFIDVPFYNSGHLQVHGSTGLDAKLTVATGFTNDGAIQLASVGSPQATLVVTGGTLINMPGATIDMPALNSLLDLELDNRGTVTTPVDPSSRCVLDTAATVHHSNSGTINVGTLFAVDLRGGSTFDFSGTLSVADRGNMLIVSPGTPGTFSWHAGTTMSGAGQLGILHTNVSLQGDVSTSAGFGNVALTDATTVNGPGMLTNSSGAEMGLGVATINTPFLNNGNLGVLQGTINGALTTMAGSSIRVQHANQNGDGTLTVANGFTNHGTIQLTGDVDSGPAELAVTSGTLVNAADGVIETLAGAHAGSRKLTAALNNQGTVNINVDTTLAGSVSNSGTVAIGPGATLTVTGNYTQVSAGTLDVQLGGNPESGQFGMLAVNGTATLAGTLQVELVNSYPGNPGDTFTILTGSRTGDFGTLDVPPGAVWDVSTGTVGF